MGRTLDLFGQPSPYRPHSPRGATLSVAKKDERVALIFWARTALSQRRDVITRSGEHSGEGDLLISRGELRRSDALVKPWYPRFGSRFWKVRPGRFQKTRCKHRCRRRGSQGRVFATGKTRGYTGFIRATPLSEDPQSAASRLIAHPERSTKKL
jgi:hypothetical protein